MTIGQLLKLVCFAFYSIKGALQIISRENQTLCTLFLGYNFIQAKDKSNE